MFKKNSKKNKQMKKSIIILLCLFLCFVETHAQKDPSFTLFPWASMYYNPGAAGEQNNTLNFTALYRNGYLGNKSMITNENGEDDFTKASNQDFLFNMEFYSRKIKGAFGLSIISDQEYAINRIGVRLGYAYKMNLGGGKLGIGLQAGLLNLATSFDDFNPIQDGDELLDRDIESLMYLDFNFGVQYRTDRWYVGLSGTQLLGSAALLLSGDQHALAPVRQIHLTGGYTWTLPWNPNWTIEPQAKVSTDFAVVGADIMVLARYNGVVWGGLSYRITDAVNILAGARPFYNSSNNYLKGLEIAISYGVTTKAFGYVKNGSFGDFEVVVRYGFDIFKQEVFSGYGSSRSIYKNKY